jgi:CRP/FNR family transcriptional regulator, polysaccharide utilization system transcription regulator
MKFKTHINCEQCSISCDIFRITQANKKKYSVEINPIQVEYKRHEIICKQGKEVTHAIFMVSGSGRLFIEGFNNKNITLYILNHHSYIGLLSFFESVSYAYSVAALEDCKVCMIDINIVKKLYFDNHEFLLHLNKAFSKSVASILKKFININQKNIRGRVADSLLYLSQFYQTDSFTMKLSRKELGELSAISEENTVRILTEFKNDGIISVNGKHITLNETKLLQQIANFG